MQPLLPYGTVGNVYLGVFAKQVLTPMVIEKFLGELQQGYAASSLAVFDNKQMYLLVGPFPFITNVKAGYDDSS